MNAGTIISLVVAGFLLVFFEVFIPGGILGLIGGIIVMAAIVCAYIFEGPTWGTALLLISSIAGLVGFWLWIKFFPKTPVGRRLILNSDARDWHGSDSDGTRKDLAGKEGLAHTTLRPAGTAMIDGMRVDVVTRGEMIAAKTPIKVIKVEGNRVVVTTTE